MESRTQADEADIRLLVERIKQGDREAFMEVTRLYQRKVFVLAYSILRNKEDALDVVQETFLRLYQKAHLFRSERNFRSWLLQVAKNVSIDVYRKNHSRSSPWTGEELQDGGGLPSGRRGDDHASLDLKPILTRCLDALSERQRTVFVLKHFNHLPYKEIAQVLDIAVGTVKSLHFKAVRNLRALLSPYLGRTG